MKGSGYNTLFFSLVNGSGRLQSLSLQFATFFCSFNCRMENINFVFHSVSNEENAWDMGNISKTPAEVLVIMSSCIYIIIYH